LNLVKNIIW